MPLPKKIDPEKHYRVTLAKACEIASGVWARPGDDVAVLGAVLVTIEGAVIAAELVD